MSTRFRRALSTVVSVLRAAAPAHVEAVRRQLVDLATPAELAALAALAERVVAEVGDLS